ncbi:hypothetical protein [Thalassospira sp.]|uniref:hypothetical protein n=1 Tax=Thalassospira sp. TaxID=1912094 RepID=UPI000C442BA9|nr:hypothetical protein [Thalassospira sp.]MBC06334.1 hypothetical protein [Thalassospira sp.]|tara:strand:+ start:6636 stop:6935 length:300 start_codon:yes stop_codon:yes gene_type:complete
MSHHSAHNPDARAALADLAIVAAGFLRGRGRMKAREHLRKAIHEANEALRAGGSVADHPVTISDPEQLVRAYIEAGGNWQELVAAVSRHSLEGATRRHD